MGDMSGGGGMGGGKSAGGAGGGMPADASGGLGLGGGDPMAGGGGFADPMMGGDPTGSMGFGGDTFGMAADPSMGLQTAMQGPQALTQPPITDQPSAPAAGAPQAAPAPPPQPPQLDKAQALFGGPSSHPDWGFGDQPAQGPSGTPGAPVQTASRGDIISDTGKDVGYTGLDPKTNLGGQRGPSIEIPGITTPGEQDPASLVPSQEFAFPQAAIPGTAGQIPLYGDPSSETGSLLPGQSPTSLMNTPDYPGGATAGRAAIPGTAGQIETPIKPDSAPSQTANVPLPQPDPRTSTVTPQTTAQPGTAGGGSATPGITPPGTSAPAGAGMQSPLEQLVSGFIHMLTGQGMGALQQLIGRFLGINPRQLFPQFYGGGFNRPAGPGYFPAGTTGGRAIGPNAQPASLQTPSQPGGPQSPQTPEAPRTALPPPTRYTDTPRGSKPVINPNEAVGARATGMRAPGSLPGTSKGVGYTADRPDRPPPWYHPERNPAARGRRMPTLQGGRDSGMRGGVPRQDIPYNGTPASIRYNNPGAQFPSAAAKKFGMTGYGVLGHSKITGEPLLIARFPDAQHGAAANMDLFARKYTGKTIGQAGKDWTGSYSSGVPGYNPHMVITRQMFNDPNFVIPFMKALTAREAGRASPLTDSQWQQAFDLYQAGGEPATAVGF